MKRGRGDMDVGGGMHLSRWWHFRLVVEKAEENNPVGRQERAE